jgi:hypothetical protein
MAYQAGRMAAQSSPEVDKEMESGMRASVGRAAIELDGQVPAREYFPRR